jgi:argininosuccinate lyase
LFGAVDLMLLVLPAVAGTLQELKFDRERMRAALSSTMMATDLADYLVGKGSTFREAHEAVGTLIREAEGKGCELTALPRESFTATHPLFGDDALAWLDPVASVARRDLPGGTGPNSVRNQLASAREAIRPVRETPRGNELNLRIV